MEKILYDDKLNLKLKSLLLQIDHLENVTVGTLLRYNKDGYTSLISGLKQLESLGYIGKTRDEANQFTPYIYYVKED